MSLTTVAYDPKTTATQLADLSTSAQQKILTEDVQSTKVMTSSIAELKTALLAFQSALSGFTSTQSALVTNATFSADVGTATASVKAENGSYSIFVEQLAKANQMSYSGISDTPAADSGILKVKIADGSSFDVDLSTADADGNGTLSAKELGAAINRSPGNTGRITASVATFNGTSSLILTSNNTGAANAATLDTAGVSNAALKAQLDTAANQKVFVAGKDAVIWLGDQGTGTKIQQASNTFSIVDGVKMTFTKAQTAGSDPVNLTVGADATATSAKISGFVDAWNKLGATIKELMAHGDLQKEVAPAAFASDSGLQALKTKMESLLRTTSAGKQLANYGVIAQRDGTLSLDSVRFTKAFAADPAGLDKIVGSVDGAGTGVVGGLNNALNGWTGRSGQLSAREDSVTTHEDRLQKRQDKLDEQHTNAYNRYLAQFTRLQTLQDKMSQTSSMFDALFSSSNN